MVAGYDGPGGEPGDPQGILPPACVTPSLRPALPALGKPGDVLSLKPRGREEGGRGAPQLESYSEACLREAGGCWGICGKFTQSCLK